MGPGNFPPSIDFLVQQRFLRKKYKDPITDGDFQIIPVAAGFHRVSHSNRSSRTMQQGGGRGRGQSPFGQMQQGQQARAARRPSRRAVAWRAPGQFGGGSGQFGGASGQFVGEGGQTGGGIMGVVSKSKDTSIRVYHGGTHYNQWTFLFSNVSNRPGGAGGQGAPGVPGGQRGRGGRGGPGSPGQGSPGQKSRRRPAACRVAGSVRRAAVAVSARAVPEWDAVAAGNSLPRADGPVTLSLGRHAPVGG